MDKSLNSEIETNLETTIIKADETKTAAKEWAEASKEMHDEALQSWKDASKRTLEQLQADHKEIEKDVKGKLVFNAGVSATSVTMDAATQAKRLKSIAAVNN